jgi:hypothetical protein
VAGRQADESSSDIVVIIDVEPVHAAVAATQSWPHGAFLAHPAKRRGPACPITPMTAPGRARVKGCLLCQRAIRHTPARESAPLPHRTRPAPGRPHPFVVPRLLPRRLAPPLLQGDLPSRSSQSLTTWYAPSRRRVVHAARPADAAADARPPCERAPTVRGFTSSLSRSAGRAAHIPSLGTDRSMH